MVVPLVDRVDEAFIRQGTFGLIQQYGVGLETVDIEAATKNGVMVARIPSEESGNAASVAEHAVLLMLMLSRKLIEIAGPEERVRRSRGGHRPARHCSEKPSASSALAGSGGNW